MYHKLTEEENDLLKKIRKSIFINAETIGDFISAEDLIEIIRELYDYYEYLEEEYEEYKKDVEINYIRRKESVDPDEFYG